MGSTSDGLVRDYFNWDEDEDGTLDGYYHFPMFQFPGANWNPTWSVPGDTVQMYYHLNERIDGYQAWSMLSTDVASFDPADPSATDSSCQVFYRERGNQVSGIHEYLDKPYVVHVNPYSDERYRKAELASTLNVVDNYLDPVTGELNPENDLEHDVVVKGFNFDAAALVPSNTHYYDIVIAPFAYVDGNPYEGMTYGTTTRLHDVLKAKPVDYGPQYYSGGYDQDRHLKLELPHPITAIDEDPEHASEKGLHKIIVTQHDPTDPNKKDIIDFIYYNADDVNHFGEWGNNTVVYELYAASTEAGVFSSTNIIDSWTEGAIVNYQPVDEEYDVARRKRTITFDDNSGGLPFGTEFSDTDRIYFGIRAKEVSDGGLSADLVEYSTYGEPNTNIVEWRGDLTTDNYGPQYNPTDLASPPGAVANTINGLLKVEQVDHDSFNIWVTNADDVDYVGNWDMPDGKTNVTYDLYCLHTKSPSPVDSEEVFQVTCKIDSYLENTFATIDYVHDQTVVTALHRSVDLDMSAFTDLGLNDTLWFGVYAVQADYAENDEYDSVEGPANTDNNNTEVLVVTYKDLGVPYFVTIGTFGAQNFPSCAENDDVGFFRTNSSTCTKIKFGFNPAVDPPLYESDQFIRYDLYVSDAEMTSIPSGGEFRSKILRYSDWWHNNGSSKTPVGDPGRNEHYIFEFTQDHLEQPILAGTGYWILVVAYDLTDENGGNHSIVASEELFTNPDIGSDPIGSGMSYEQANNRGSIKRYENDLHMIYPTGDNTTGRPDFNYSFLDDGIYSAANSDVEILSGSTTFTPHPWSWMAIGQASIDFKLNSLGQYEMSNSLPIPIVAFTGDARVYVDDTCKLYSAYRDTSGTGPAEWKLTHHESATDIAGIPQPCLGANTASLFSYQCDWYDTTGLSHYGEYFLSWMNNPNDRGPLSPYPDPLCDMWWKSRSSSLGLWPEGIWQYSSEAEAYIKGDKQAAMLTCSGSQASNCIRDLGYVYDPNVYSQVAAKGNALFHLSCSPHDRFSISGETYPTYYSWHDISLCYTGHPDPTPLPSPYEQVEWQYVDIKSVIDDTFRVHSDEDTSYGPNSLAVCRQNAFSDDANVYVSYVDSLEMDDTGGDGTGLRIIHSTYSKYPTQPNGYISGSWDSTPIGGCIDDTFFFSSEFRELFSSGGTAGLVDLKCKPSARAQGAGPYEGLGCAYIHPKGKYGVTLVYSESNGANAPWTKASVNSEFTEAVDIGSLLWVKLEYASDDSPYILYAMADPSLDSGESYRYVVKVWTP